MKKKENKKITNIELLKSINRSFSKVEKRMATKDDLINLELKLTTDIHDLRMEVKGFKKDTGDSVERIKEDVIDLTDTVMGHDKRIEKLEKK